MGWIKGSGAFAPIKNKMVELYNYRNFIHAQVTRNLFGKYRNSFLGFSWNFLNPIVYIILCYIIFAEIRGIQIEGYLIFLSSGVFIYNLLLGAVTGGGGLFVGNGGMIKKMYFPREILAISNAISSLIIAVIGYVIVIITALLTNHSLDPVVLLCIIPYLFLAFIFFIGCSLLLGSVAVYVRDLQFILPTVGIILFVCSPLRSMASDADGLLAWLYELNPFTYFLEPIHLIVYYSEYPSLAMLLVAVIISVTFFIVGYIVFLKLRHGFVERL